MKKHLHELLGWPGPMTHRQFRAWRRWLVEQCDQPSLTHWYLMQLTAELRRGVGVIQVERQRDVSMDQCRLGRAVGTERPLLTEEQQRLSMEASKAFWRHQMGKADRRGGGR